MNIRVRQFGGLRAVAVSETAPSDLALINTQYALSPLDAGDLHVRQARVAHNQHDRTLERFPKAMLERFAETLPGKSLLPGHDTSALPLGRWFRADTRTRTEDFPILVQAGKSAGAEIIPGYETQRQRVTWLEGAFYFAADSATEGMRKNIDSGVYQDVSIGYKYDDIDCDVCMKSYLKSDCPHYAGQWLKEKAALVTLTYSGDPKLYEARETSIVYLGAQQQAELKKQLRLGLVDPQALAETPYGTDLVDLKRFEALARHYGHQPKAWAFPALKSAAVAGTPAALTEFLGALAFGDSSPADAGETTEITQDPSLGGSAEHSAAKAEQGEAEMALLEEARKRLGLSETADETAVLAGLADAQKAAGEMVTVEKALADAKPLSDIGAKALANAAKEYVDNCKKLGTGETQAVAVAELFTSKQDYDGLRKLVEETFAEVCKRFPSQPLGAVLGDGNGVGTAPLRSRRLTEYPVV